MDDDPNGSRDPAAAQPGGYANFQLARALTAAGHAEASVREHAAKRIRQWTSVILGSADGSIVTGSRTPVKDTPAWATLEVATGGFSTGNLLAGGSLKVHERLLRDEVASDAPESETRFALNRFFLTDEGLARLQAMLDSGRFDIGVPEEGAMLAIAWLVRGSRSDIARALVDELTPYFSKLRFYPVPALQAREYGMRVCVEDVAAVLNRLQAVTPNPQVLAQKEAIEIWRPIYDRMVGLFLETVTGELPLALKAADGTWQRNEAGGFTVTGGWPCARYPEDWSNRALALLDHCKKARTVHVLCTRPEREGDSFAALREYLRQCASSPEALSGKDVGRIRLIVARYVAKRGLPDAPERDARRQQQLRHAAAPTFEQISRQVALRLEAFRADDGLEDIASIVRPIDATEVASSGIAEGTLVPPTLHRKIVRCHKGTIAELIQRNTVPSGEVLAQVLPQWTSTLRAAGIADPALRRLYASIYRAFRRRRSLLLVNLQSQVQIEELPWVAAIENLRQDDGAVRRTATQVLAEVAQLAITAFPQAILPNKLLRELRALDDAAGLNLPLVEEVAVDIFMGRFSPKFLVAAKSAASVVQGSLYAAYYGIDALALAALPDPVQENEALRGMKPDALALLCASRAGVALEGWGTARNGMVIEQAQILTTHNLAALFAQFDLDERLSGQLPGLARQCFAWVCRRLQIRVTQRHARLIQIKNSAFAWRQMVFVLSRCSPEGITEFMAWARAHLSEQPKVFQQRFNPALSGLEAVVAGQGDAAKSLNVRPFLGWSQEAHWLMQGADSGAH